MTRATIVGDVPARRPSSIVGTTTAGSKVFGRLIRLCAIAGCALAWAIVIYWLL